MSESTQEETLISHLIELRNQLLKMVLSILLIFVLLLPWSKELYTLLAKPMLAALPDGGQMIATGVVGVFLVPIKVSAALAFLIALPYVLYQAWSFIAPGLYNHEKKLAFPLVASSVLLFIFGMFFAYLFVFPAVFVFMAAVAPEGVTWMTDIENYFSFVITTFFAFGIAFEVPVVVNILVRSGIADVHELRRYRPYIIVVAFVISAVVTPPDVISQIMLAVPMWLLYEGGIWFAEKTIKKDPDEYST